ncbi:MAG: hypothetical protein Q8O11_06345, partial [Syntrophales bacterium]|nr:hypothetical protein [Syntrophales bacterium]
ENLPYVVTPAKAGVQKVLKRLDSCFRRNDKLPNFGRNSKVSLVDLWLKCCVKRENLKNNTSGRKP